MSVRRDPAATAIAHIYASSLAGRCSFEAGYRHVDVSKVIWLGTSNIGHDLVFEHQDSRPAPATQLSREEYVDLMGLLRPRVSDRLGVSLIMIGG